MYQDRIIKKIPGEISKPLTRERQGYIEDLTSMPQIGLLEVLERQKKLLSNKRFIAKLPDKGSRIIGFQQRILQEVSRRDEVEHAGILLSGLKLAADELEWTGQAYSQGQDNGEVLDSDDASDDDTNPLKMLASNAGEQARKKIIRIEKSARSLIKPGDVEQLKEGAKYKPTEDIYIKTLCDKFETKRETKKKPFKPYQSTILRAGGDASSISNYKKPLGPHWEITAASPPPDVHGEIKVISLNESLELQKQQVSTLKEIQMKNASERLMAQLGIKMGAGLPGPALRSVYRDRVPSESSSSGEEGTQPHSEDEEDEEPDKDGAVVFQVVD